MSVTRTQVDPLLSQLFSTREIPTLAAFTLKLTVSLTQWHRNLTTRRHLAKLDQTQLRDIGLTKGAAYKETIKPFWVN